MTDSAPAAAAAPQAGLISPEYAQLLLRHHRPISNRYTAADGGRGRVLPAV